MVKSSDIIFKCFVNLTDGLMKYQDNWMSDETWFRVISSRYPDVINSIGFLRTTFIRAISMHASQCGTQNAMGIFIHQFATSCPYDSGKRRRVSYFYDNKESQGGTRLWPRIHCKHTKIDKEFRFKRSNWDWATEKEEGTETETPVEHLINSPLETTVGCCVFAHEIKSPVW